MLYKAEVVVNKRVIAHLQGDATNPQQAVRRVLDVAERAHQHPDYMSVYVMNERGEVWVFAITRKEGRYHGMITHKSRRCLPRNIVVGVFSGNVAISEVV